MITNQLNAGRYLVRVRVRFGFGFGLGPTNSTSRAGRYLVRVRFRIRVRVRVSSTSPDLQPLASRPAALRVRGWRCMHHTAELRAQAARLVV